MSCASEMERNWTEQERADHTAGPTLFYCPCPWDLSMGDLLQDPFLVCIHIITDPGEAKTLQSAADRLLSLLHPQLTLFRVSERAERPQLKPQCPTDLHLSLCPCLSVILFLQDYGGEESHEQQLRRPPWRYHHTEQVQGLPFSPARQDFFMLAPGTPLWALRKVRYGKEIVRFTIYCRYETYSDQVRLYGLLLRRRFAQRNWHYSFCVVYSNDHMEIQLSCKRSPEGQDPTPTECTLMEIRVRNMAGLIPLLPHPCRPISDIRWQTKDYDGNKILIQVRVSLAHRGMGSTRSLKVCCGIWHQDVSSRSFKSWKGRELADVMERRKVDILCVQETRWKGSKARSIGAGFKLFYYGVDSKRNGVGVVLKEEFVRNVLEVKRVSDRVMSLKLEIEGVMLNVVSGYAPQVGCELEEKERFWSELDEVMESIPMGERVVIGADFNGHVGEGNTGDEEVMGKFGVKERNLEGQMVVDFAKRMDMGVVNTYFQKREEHRVTYKSGGRSTQVDYILCRRGNLKEISDCKVVVGESVARQHRMVVCRMTLMACKKKRSEIEKKTKWWKLEKEECCEEFRQKLRQALGGQVVLPDDWETTAEVIRETGRKVLGVSSGRRKEDKETWWWNEEVQDSIQRNRLAKKKWDMDRTEENRQEYKELQRIVKREVSKAKQKAYDELYTRLDTREGEKDLYRLARQRDRDGKDVQQVRVIKDRDGRVLTSEESVQRRWKEYFEELMNEENEREKRVEGVNSVEQKVDKIRKDEVRKALKRMKSGKAVGPDDIPVEVWKCLGEAAVEFLASLFNRVLESERMPEEWRRSVLVPIFKNKGDVQSCSNYRGIKLMSHTMKLWERVVEARLRKVVEICEQQYGFMPRKSTTDAIFALRILMEKYRDGQRELHCVFVDLEKAYDRVPREELWYCMRKSGVAEKYVRVVQDMYERSRTVVRCAVGQTEEFNVEVGLHQGSALSPFLFAIVMDQLSEEVRQESPWTMMFADDIVICSESREQVEENLERWRFALERRGMKVSGSKTEYMCVNEREGSGTLRLQGEEVKKVQEFKYLGSTVQSNGECGKEVKKRVQAGWNGWRKVSGVLCDRKLSARIKGKVYRTVVRPAMLYGLETVSLRKRQESELQVAELKMLRFSLGVTRLDRIRNEYIRGTAHVGRLGDKVREARLRWFGHVQRRE
ncbi:hypothetical protein QTP70_022062, partial [Hemibagrus guttatus]